jgi:DNA-binding transcriptional MerR regulator
MAKWTPEQKQKALAIAEATSAREAAKKTGIPLSTIGRWMGEQKRNGTEHLERNGTSKKVKQIAEEATEEAKAEVREFVADRAKQVANDILGMVQQALAEAEAVIQNGPNDDEPKAAWLRAVIGAMAQGVEKHQLMTGKPTNRQALEGQVTNRYEYDITHRIEQYADVYRKLAGRGVFCSSDAGDDSGEQLDTT